MNTLNDIITYFRRIIKSASDLVVSTNLAIDYINRFWLMDVDARIQVFDLKSKYQFQTTPTVDKYNMPLYNVQTEPGGQIIASYPVYQGFLSPCYINGIPVSFQTQKNQFYNSWINVVQYLEGTAIGNGTVGPYTINFPILSNVLPSPPNPPLNAILRGHVDMYGIIATGNNIDPPIVSNFLTTIPVTSVDSAVFITSTDATGANIVVQDSGQFLEGNINYGLLMTPGQAPFGNTALPGGYSTTSNTINYLTGVANVLFPVAVPAGENINAQCYYYESGLSRAVLFYNNTLTLRMPPAFQYLVEIEAYLSPAAFLNTEAGIPFGYMAEYIARGAARKYLSDIGDVDQFNFYEPLFKEQESLVWKRSQRQWTATRTETIYSQGTNQGVFDSNLFGGNVV